MKKLSLIFVLLGLAAGILCAKELPLKDIIEQSARNVEEALNEGTTVAVVNFTSPSEVFSDHVIEELTGELVNGKKVVIVDRIYRSSTSTGTYTKLCAIKSGNIFLINIISLINPLRDNPMLL